LRGLLCEGGKLREWVYFATLVLAALDFWVSEEDSTNEAELLWQVGSW